MMFVDPTIGSGGFGYGAGGINPGAQVPFGSLRLGPDTALGDRDIVLSFQHSGGYAHSDNKLRAFSHTHLVGAGASDYGNFGVVPIRFGDNPSENVLRAALLEPANRTLPFDHSNEHALPGHYSLGLPSIGVQADVAAAGTHAGVHEYAYQAHEGSCGLIFDACHNAAATASWCANATIALEADLAGTSLTVRASVRMAGTLSMRAANGSVPIYFHGTLTSLGDARLDVWRLWESEQLLAVGARAANGSHSLGALIRVPCGTTVRLTAAISWISAEQAEATEAVQLPSNTSVSSAAAAARASWAALMSGVEVIDAADASTDELTKFHSAVYRTFLAPSTWSEPALDGSHHYLGMDGELRRLGQRADDARERALTDMSLWDTHRTLLPWLSLTQPTVYEDTVRSLQAMGEEGGDVPRWPLANVYTGCMIGNHAAVVLAEAVAKGHTRFNASSMYDMLALQATTPRPHAGRAAVEDWVRLGYVPHEAGKDAPPMPLMGTDGH